MVFINSVAEINDRNKCDFPFNLVGPISFKMKCKKENKEITTDNLLKHVKASRENLQQKK